MIKKIIQLLGNLIKSFYKKEPKINLEDFLIEEAIKTPASRILEWAEAIKTFEGFYPGSKSHRNNNPGNIKNTNGTFLVFDTYQIGLDYLCRYLERACKGEHTAYKPDFSLLQFFEVYAPSNDGNSPQNYARFVAQRLNVSIGIKIKELI